MSQKNAAAPAGSLTVRQLATLAGVSRTTVSLALRNHPCVALPTRQKIRDLAEKHNYRADSVASSLATRLRVAKKNRTADRLAFLTLSDSPDSWVKLINERRYLDGVRQRAARLGYEVDTFWAKDPRMTNARMSQILYTRSIRGIILPPMLHAMGHLSLRWENFTTVAIGLTIVKPAVHRVAHAHMNGMVLALRKLKQRGYHRIGFANLQSQNDRVGNNWLAGYLTYFQITAPEKLIPPLFVTKWNRNEFRKWVDTHKLDAVLSNSTEPFQMLADLKYQIPEKIAFASLDRLRPETGFAGIDQHPEKVGASAVDLLITQIHNNEFGLPETPHTLLLEGEWVEGETVRLAADR